MADTGTTDQSYASNVNSGRPGYDFTWWFARGWYLAQFAHSLQWKYHLRKSRPCFIILRKFDEWEETGSMMSSPFFIFINRLIPVQFWWPSIRIKSYLFTRPNRLNCTGSGKSENCLHTFSPSAIIATLKWNAFVKISASLSGEQSKQVIVTVKITVEIPFRLVRFLIFSSLASCFFGGSY